MWQRLNPSWPITNHADFHASVRRTPETNFRMYCLNQFVRGGSVWLPHGAWDKLARPNDVIVVGVDAAHRNDSTAIVGVRLRDLHVERLDHWEADPNNPHWRTPIH